MRGLRQIAQEASFSDGVRNSSSTPFPAHPLSLVSELSPPLLLLLLLLLPQSAASNASLASVAVLLRGVWNRKLTSDDEIPPGGCLLGRSLGDVTRVTTAAAAAAAAAGEASPPEEVSLYVSFRGVFGSIGVNVGDRYPGLDHERREKCKCRPLVFSVLVVL